MRLRFWLVAAIAAASLAAVPGGAAARSAGKHGLDAFSSCSSFVHYARRHARGELTTRGIPVGQPIPPRSPQPMNGQVAPQAAEPTTGGAGQDFSGTNVQEAGVDEPDQVKTDGGTIFTVENGTLYAVDARSDAPRLLGSLALGGYRQQLLLAGDRLLVLSGSPVVYGVVPLAGTGAPAPRAAVLAPSTGGTQRSTLTLVDVSRPAAMKVLETMSVNGGYLDARITGHTARVVFSATPRILPLLASAASTGPGRALRRSTTPDWRPTYVLRHGARGRRSRHALVRCTAVGRPARFSGLNSLTVLTVDIDKGLVPVDSDAIMTDGQTVYASRDSLYLAMQKAIVEKPDAARPPSLSEQQTEIHAFDISDPDATTYEGSGVVAGTLLGQYSMSEQDGYLRVASTSAPLWWSPGETAASQSYVTVLRRDGGGLAQVGRVGDLGRGERIYAVRFIGDVGYVVTFRQIDPLYTIGLSDPASPKVLGSVDLSGYSSYLHPVGDGLLLGVGQAAGPQDTEPDGVQVSLFDVSDPAKPARISNALVGSGSSTQAQFDPHAFLWWGPAKLALLPMQIYDGDASQQFDGAIGFHVTKADGVKEQGRLSHPAGSYGYAPPIDRSLVVGDKLFTVSQSGVLASDLASFTSRGFAAFPAP